MVEMHLKSVYHTHVHAEHTVNHSENKHVSRVYDAS